MFDKDLENILPALWYILHLPRTGFDVVDIDANTVLSSHDNPHNIWLSPSLLPNIATYVPNFGHTLVVYEDDCEKEAKNQHFNSLIDIVSVSKLSVELLKKHWQIIGELMKCHIKCTTYHCVYRFSYRFSD